MSMRRFRAGGRRSARPSAFAAIDRAFAATFTAGSARFDASRATLSGANLSTLVDYMDPTHSLSVEAGTIVGPAAHADFLGKPCIALTGTQNLISNRAAGLWKHLHDGTGYSSVVVCTVTTLSAIQCLWSTRASSGFGAGSMFYTATATLSHVTGNGSANPFAPAPTTAATQVVLDQPTWFASSYMEGASPEGALRKGGSVVASGASLAAPSSSDPAATLRVGAFSDGSRLSARIRAVYFWPYVLSAAQWSAVAAKVAIGA